MSKFRSDFHLVLAVLLILVLMIPLSLNSSQTHDIVTNISDLPIKDNVISYTTSSAINITSNADFALQGFPGSGSAEDPYRIDNLSIAVDGDCIKVVNTTAHFVISNCYLLSNTTELGSGVYLYNVSNCRITDCIIQNKDDGCKIYWFTSNCTISENQISYCESSGIFSAWASHCTITENTISHNPRALELLGGGGGTSRTRFFNISHNTLRYNSWGIDMNAAESCIIDHNIIEDGATAIYGSLYNMTITNNQIDSMSHTAIDLGTDAHGVIQNNHLTNIGNGLYLYNADNLTISYNVFEHCGTGIYSFGNFMLFEWNNFSFCRRGIELHDCHDCLVRNNQFSDNDWQGLYLSASTFNNSIYYNTFRNNQISNAKDLGETNRWDDGINRGNVWDDYIGIGWYTISGSSGSIDRYPDNPEHGLQYNVILPPIGLGIFCVVCIILLYQRRDLIRARIEQSR